MSFRGDDERRYGQVPPVRYPVSARPAIAPGSSLDSADDIAAHGSLGRHLDVQAPMSDELFMTSPTAPGHQQHNNRDATCQTPPSTTTRYNPQSYAHSSHTASGRSHSATLPHHAPPAPRHGANSYSTSPPARYASSPYNPAVYASTNGPQRQPTYPGHSRDQAYSSASPTHGHSPAASYSNSSPQPLQSPTRSSGLQQSHANSPSSPRSQPRTPVYDPLYYAANHHMLSHNSNAGPQNSAPYPLNSQIPVGPNYQTNEDESFYNSQPSSRSTSFVQSQSHSPPAALQRHPTNAPLPSRPTDALQDEASYWDSSRRPLGSDYSNERMTQDAIMHEIEAELDGPSHRRRPLPPSPVNGHVASRPDGEGRRRNSSGAGSRSPLSRRRSPITSHGYGGRRQLFDEADDDDDAEGAAGVLAMHEAELEDERFNGSAVMHSQFPPPTAAHSNRMPLPPRPEEERFADDDLGGVVDLGALSGGYAANMTYGATSWTMGMHESTRPLPTGAAYKSLGEECDKECENAPGFRNADMDYVGTGGLQSPRVQRLSFDQGGEEQVSVDSWQNGSESPAKEDIQDLFYHPGLSNRPLPALPRGTGSDSSSYLSAHHSSHWSLDQQPFVAQTDSFEAAATGPERSISLCGHSNTPQVQAPARSRTDAAEERKKLVRHQLQGLSPHAGTFSDYDGAASTVSGGFDSITLPSGRKKKFSPSKLTAADFGKCGEAWALSGLEAWIRAMGEGEMDLRGKTIQEALILLFDHKVPTMKRVDMEGFSAHVVQQMLDAGVLVAEEEWVKFGPGHISGVWYAMSRGGCYTARLHDYDHSGLCYAPRCERRAVPETDEDDWEEAAKQVDWNVFHGLSRAEWEAKPKKEVERQNILHEIVSGEENYMKQLDIFRRLYLVELQTRTPAIIHPERRDKFLAAVFGKLERVIEVNRQHLLLPLSFRRREQGPWIVGFSDIFREWIRKAKKEYIEYASGFPRASWMVRKEAERNIVFSKFLAEQRKDKRSAKQDWTHFIIGPLQRLQRYILLLESVDHKMAEESEEKTNQQRAIEEIKAVTSECDSKVAEQERRITMMQLDRELVLRPGFQSVLNLDHLGRLLIMRGDLQRMGSKGMRWVDTHAILFDHYLILAKVLFPKEARTDRKYDVSKEPIPMPLLCLESVSDEPVTKQKGITAPLGRTTSAVPSAASQMHKPTASGAALEHTASGSSSATTALAASVSAEAEGKTLYPFRVKHLGHETYTLYASMARDRHDWCRSILDAKTRHAKALHSQNAEPFRLRVLADASFHYDAGRPPAVSVKGTPLHRALQDIEAALGSPQGTAPVCRAHVNCAAGFVVANRAMIVIGTDYGIFVSDTNEPRAWRRTVQVYKVTQIAVLEDFALCLVIADKSLVSFPLDVVAPTCDFARPVSDNPRNAPQRLAKDVGYFATARMKGRMLVFYKRKEGLHTSFKVLEPVVHKASEKRLRLFGGRKGPVISGGHTESFRDFDEFYLPTECYSLSLFHTYIAVATAKGIEMLTLDKKQPMSIPDLKAPGTVNIAGRIRDQRPLGMFRLNDTEFILTYEDCAVYVDKHGDVSRTLIMEYTGKQKKARGATMYGQYLLLFNDDYVEVRNADNGRLRQIIAGRDVRVIDYGMRGPTGSSTAPLMTPTNGKRPSQISKGTVKIAMSHPELPGRQIILEMLLNEGLAE
ncbi:hypothetical protein CDD82_3568 [Ophiocordyceps australis]|uniref:DH domain-containing protein n=1 Tax=Ophiocordyceps australis TaxID=1399860 RepID=A0A2C5ZC50_9HYPO|nr:hypothetical protein CDD82_3568 [Ophiocordyceps australis]